MIMDFSIVSVEPSLLENAITIYFSKDVDPDSVNPDDIFVMTHDNRAAVPFDIETDEDTVKITSKTGFEPNTDYMILVQGGITDLVGTELADPLVRTVHFGGDVTNIVRVVEPIDFEIVDKIAMRWEEYDKNGKIITPEDILDFFEVQIAQENAFYNIVCTTTTAVGDTNVVLKEPIEEGQYYFRVRARNGEQFGRWSNVGTFVFKKKEDVPVEDPPAEDDPGEETPAPEHTDDGITIVDFSSTKGILNKPTYRLTTEAEDTCFQLVFDEPVDISDLKMVVRRSDL